jgi:hypothetical protein
MSSVLRRTIALGEAIAIHPVSKLTIVIASLRQLNMNKTLALVLTAASLGGTAIAQTQPASNISPLAPIYACAEKTDAAARLACFDAAVAAVKAAEARSEIVAMDQPRVAAVRREAFGFRIPSLPRFGLGGGATAAAAGASAGNAATPAARQRDEQLEEQTFAVTRVGRVGNRVALYLENGSVWHFTDADELNAPRQTPFNVRIRSAAMGSYLLQVEGRNKGYRVRRVE